MATKDEQAKKLAELKRLKQLLNMAMFNDKPHEAANALSLAQRHMAKCNLTLDDFDSNAVNSILWWHRRLWELEIRLQKSEGENSFYRKATTPQRAKEAAAKGLEWAESKRMQAEREYGFVFDRMDDTDALLAKVAELEATLERERRDLTLKLNAALTELDILRERAAERPIKKGKPAGKMTRFQLFEAAAIQRVGLQDWQLKAADYLGIHKSRITHWKAGRAPIPEVHFIKMTEG